MTAPERSRPDPTSRTVKNRYVSLDLWRGLACLMIVVLHGTHLAQEGVETAGISGKLIVKAISKLSVGVPMFFVISGYCIAATSDNARRQPRASARFFYRRARRIFPPYWVMIAISAVLSTTLA